MRSGIFFWLVMIAATVFIWYKVGYARGYDAAKHKYCQHGESSITATKVNGKFVESKPVRTGC